MSTINKKIFLIILGTFLVTTVTTGLYAQNKKRLDSLIDLVHREEYKNPDKAIKIGMTIVKEAGNNVDFKIKGYSVLSDAYSLKRCYEKALKYDLKAEQLLQLSTDELLKIKYLNNTGVRYQQLNIYDKAIKYLDQAEQSIMKYPYKDSIHVCLATNYIVRGIIFKDKLDTDLAIDYFGKAISELSKSNSGPNNYYRSITNYNIANCYLLQSKYKFALQYFTEANTNGKIINDSNLQAFALKGMAKVYAYQGNYFSAIQTLEKAKQYSIGSKDLILIRGIYGGLAENYLSIDNLEAYKVNYTKYLVLVEEINEHEQKSVNDSLNEKANELRTDLNNETKKFYWIIFSSVLVLTVMIILLHSATKKRLKIIKTKKAEINSIFNNPVNSTS